MFSATHSASTGSSFLGWLLVQDIDRSRRAKLRALVALVASILSLLLLAACAKPPPQAELGAPLLGLAQEHVERFQKGKLLFEHKFVPETGLGPLFNADACGECHEDPVTGGAGDEVEVHSTKFSAPEACDPLFQEGGPVIQQLATPLLRAKGVEKEKIPPSASGQGLRSAGPIFGFGLIDGIPESTILANEDPDDSDRDRISRRANRFIDGRVGRFGRKAFVPSLFEFNAGAFP